MLRDKRLPARARSDASAETRPTETSKIAQPAVQHGSDPVCQSEADPGRRVGRIHGRPTRQQLITLHDLLAVACSLVAATMLREGFTLGDGRGLALLAQVPLLLVIAHGLFSALGTYRSCWRYATVVDLAQLTLAASLVLVTFLTALFIWDRLAWMPRSVPVMQWLILVVTLCGSRIAYTALGRQRHHGGGETAPRWHPVLLVGGRGGAALVIRMLELSRSSYRVVGILDDRIAIGRTIGQAPVVGGFGDLERLLARLDLRGMRPERLIVTEPENELGPGAVHEIARQAQRAGISVDQLPDLLRFRSDSWQPGLAEAQMGWPSGLAEAQIGTVLRDVERRSYVPIKRVLDVTLSVVMLVAAAPFLVAIALGIRLTIGDPVVFAQVRPGRGLARFALYKFRTMRDAFDSEHRPLADADRTPWLGRALRRTRLDELPQLFNVLKGEMSLIGPRPMLERYVVELQEGGRERAILRPGLTGWAQVNGGDRLTLDEKLVLDLFYIRHASLTFDLWIAIRTVGFLILGERVNERAIARAGAGIEGSEARGVGRVQGTTPVRSSRPETFGVRGAGQSVPLG